MGNLLWSVVTGALPPFGGGGTIKSMDKWAHAIHGPAGENRVIDKKSVYYSRFRFFWQALFYL